MDRNKRLIDDCIKVKRERDHAEKQLISKTESFAKMQMENEKTRKILITESKNIEQEKKGLLSEQKKLKKFMSNVTCFPNYLNQYLL